MIVVLRNYQTETLIKLLQILFVAEAPTIVHSVVRGWLSYKIRAYSHVMRSLGFLLRSRRRLERKLSDAQVTRLFTATINDVLVDNFVASLNLIVRQLDGLLLDRSPTS